MHSSRAVNLNWKLTAPHLLYTNRTREMWKIEEDLTAENYCGGGYCSEHRCVDHLFGTKFAPSRQIAG